MTLHQHIINCLPSLLGEPTIVNAKSIGDLYVCDGVIYYRFHNSYATHLSKDFLNLFYSIFTIRPTEELMRIVFEGHLGLNIIYYEDEISNYDKMDFKKGDITPSGWEISEVYYKPIYTMRKRIRVTTDHKDLNGTLGYHYLQDDGYIHIVTDDGKFFRLRENEFEYI